METSAEIEAEAVVAEADVEVVVISILIFSRQATCIRLSKCSG